ncbi:TrbC family F-type conjugative pilus assembly protein (plasmid) [Psychrobium sp. nBUS_13]|uniref:TrbC family F-type conjugative pilus assembly protein n=1 Tax=Psychrobium sp. nBUS_13 TaxID=3395319 RepID=UPI003EC04DFA
MEAQKAINSARTNGLLDGLDLNPKLSQKQLEEANKVAQKSLTILNKSLPITPQKNKPAKSLFENVDGAIFISFSMPRTAIIEALKVASTNNLTVIIKGFIANTKDIRPTLKVVNELSSAAGVEPNIGIDPIEFDRYSVSAVPTIVLKSNGRVTKAAGLLNIEFVSNAHADIQERDSFFDMGVHGPIFNVEELSIIESMKSSIKDIDWEQKKANAVKRFWSNQKQVVLPDSITNEAWQIDPTVRVRKDIKNSKGLILARAGQVTNPFKKFNIKITILIINAAKNEQLQWAKHQIKSSLGAFQIHVTGINAKAGWKDIERIRSELGAPIFKMPDEVRTKFSVKALPTKISTNNDGTLNVEQFNSRELIKTSRELK